VESHPGLVRELVAAIEPADETERAHQADTLAWLDRTSDIYRRAKPATPSRHLVAYAVLMDPRDRSLFLVDHRLSGLCLPAGGHVEPGEDPVQTARREAREELGIEADFSLAGPRPVFLTVTRTVAPRSRPGLEGGTGGAGGAVGAGARHTDVSLWFVLAGTPDLAIMLDQREFAGGRWWTTAEIAAAGLDRFEPHLGRFIAKARSPRG
jgi:8-oxo-dGTP diphosphatase